MASKLTDLSNATCRAVAACWIIEAASAIRSCFFLDRGRDATTFFCLSERLLVLSFTSFVGLLSC